MFFTYIFVPNFQKSHTKYYISKSKYIFRRRDSTGLFFLSIGTRNGPVAAPFILSTCDLLQIVAKTNEFRLIYDTWPFIQSVIVEKRIPKKGENRVLGKQVLAELRRAFSFLAFPRTEIALPKIACFQIFSFRTFRMK